MKKKFILITVLLLGFGLTGCQSQLSTQEELSMPGQISKPLENAKDESEASKSGQVEERIAVSDNIDMVTLVTDKGETTIKLYKEAAPETVKNFLKKAQSGYYVDLIFHRVEDWVVQGGDPLGTGTGGAKMATELSNKPFKIGSVGVARGGDIKVSNDSQFFICTKDCSFLNNQYTNFGEVTKGMEVVNQIEIGDKIQKIKLIED